MVLDLFHGEVVLQVIAYNGEHFIDLLRHRYVSTHIGLFQLRCLSAFHSTYHAITNIAIVNRILKKLKAE